MPSGGAQGASTGEVVGFGGMVKLEDGEWLCARCKWRNFKPRKQNPAPVCVQCHAPKPMSAGVVAETMAAGGCMPSGMVSGAPAPSPIQTPAVKALGNLLAKAGQCPPPVFQNPEVPGSTWACVQQPVPWKGTQAPLPMTKTAMIQVAQKLHQMGMAPGGCGGCSGCCSGGCGKGGPMAPMGCSGALQGNVPCVTAPMSKGGPPGPQMMGSICGGCGGCGCCGGCGAPAGAAVATQPLMGGGPGGSPLLPLHPTAPGALPPMPFPSALPTVGPAGGHPVPGAIDPTPAAADVVISSAAPAATPAAASAPTPAAAPAAVPEAGSVGVSGVVAASASYSATAAPAATPVAVAATVGSTASALAAVPAVAAGLPPALAGMAGPMATFAALAAQLAPEVAPGAVVPDAASHVRPPMPTPVVEDAVTTFKKQQAEIEALRASLGTSLLPRLVRPSLRPPT